MPKYKMNSLAVLKSIVGGTIISANLLLCNTSQAETQAKVILRDATLIHIGATCAGWKFIGISQVERSDEFHCRSWDDPTYTARVQWLNSDQFIIIQTSEDLLEGKKNGRPPKVDVYEFIKKKGNIIYLKSYDTGWGNYSNSVHLFTIRKNR